MSSKADTPQETITYSELFAMGPVLWSNGIGPAEWLKIALLNRGLGCIFVDFFFIGKTAKHRVP